MALTDELPNVVVSVIVDGVALREHNDPDEPDGDGTVTRYIEAEAGKNFEIHVTLQPGFTFASDYLYCKLQVDGENADRPLIRKRVALPHTRVCAGQKLSTLQIAKFRFAQLQTGNWYSLYHNSHADDNSERRTNAARGARPYQGSREHHCIYCPPEAPWALEEVAR
jgi:hypothetical protein